MTKVCKPMRKAKEEVNFVDYIPRSQPEVERLSERKISVRITKRRERRLLELNWYAVASSLLFLRLHGNAIKLYYYFTRILIFSVF